jgi:hypothetical protein
MNFALTFSEAACLVGKQHARVVARFFKLNDRGQPEAGSFGERRVGDVLPIQSTGGILRKARQTSLISAALNNRRCGSATF